MFQYPEGGDDFLLEGHFAGKGGFRFFFVQLLVHVFPFLAERFVLSAGKLGALQVEADLYFIVFGTPAVRLVLPDGGEMLRGEGQFARRDGEVFRYLCHAALLGGHSVYGCLFFLAGDPVLAPQFDVVDEGMRNGDFVLVVYHRKFILHHPVVDVGEVVGIELVMIFDDGSFLDGGDGEFQQPDMLVHPFVGDEVPLERCLDALPVLHIIRAAVYFAGSLLSFVFVGRGVVGHGDVGVGYALRLQYFDAYPVLGHQLETVFVGEAAFALAKQVDGGGGGVGSKAGHGELFLGGFSVLQIRFDRVIGLL